MSVKEHLDVCGLLFDDIMRESYEFAERVKKYQDDKLK